MQADQSNRSLSLHTEKSFRNLINSNRNQIVFTIFRLIWNQKDVHLITKQLEKGKYNLITVWINKISKRILCVQFWPNFRWILVWLFSMTGNFSMTLTPLVKTETLVKIKTLLRHNVTIPINKPWGFFFGKRNYTMNYTRNYTI